MADNGLILTIERTFAAPVDRVWKAWSDRGTIARWWGPPGTEVLMAKHDFREGGAWRYLMPLPDGSDFVSEGEFQTIEAGHKIITTANFRPMTEGVVMEVTLREESGQTRMIFAVHHQTETQKEQQEKMGFFRGWGNAFDRLAEVV
ncbi:SRPBCC domain-containing protein [Lewinella sp. W8]|uniref:SRPBCC family protein n=1 Tax=Lewinella sp. W8 TaxID=2528208 RepID=UPI001068BF4D|nr:SRPBCC domain-containing protein [Lewinella sp. W8]MTB52112.1 activator of HSP90 ATPase [Lewinella sp. W8]